MATKSSERSAGLIKKYGWLYGKTEYYNTFVKRRFDLFGFIDLLCLDGNRTIAIQATAGKGDVATHREKMRENKNVIPWLCAGNEIQIWSWRKVVKVRGQKPMVWKCKKTDVLLVGGELYFELRPGDFR